MAALLDSQQFFGTLNINKVELYLLWPWRNRKSETITADPSLLGLWAEHTMLKWIVGNENDPQQGWKVERSFCLQTSFFLLENNFMVSRSFTLC